MGAASEAAFSTARGPVLGKVTHLPAHVERRIEKLNELQASRKQNNASSRLSRMLEFLSRRALEDGIKRMLVCGTMMGLILLLTLWLSFSSSDIFLAANAFAFGCAALFVVFSFGLTGWLLNKSEGHTAAQFIASCIQSGSEGFYKTVNKTIGVLSLMIAMLLLTTYSLRSPESLPEEIRSGISTYSFAVVSVVTFLFGCLCSSFSGYMGVWVSVRANSRVAHAASTSYQEALKLCFRGGAVSSIINVAVAIGSISFLTLIIHTFFPKIPITKVPLLLVGYSFGASFVALFAQLGGGIYTKAADIGADLVGKIEENIPEDDYRNPAVIADLVGDNVGDCAGQCADVFESMTAEILATMIVGAALIDESPGLGDKSGLGFVMLPLAVHVMDLFISTLCVMMVGAGSGRSKRELPLPLGNDNGAVQVGNPLTTMVRIYLLACAMAAVGFTFICWLMLNPVSAPGAWKKFAACGITGIFCSIVILWATQYYTDYNYAKVRQIAEASKSGPATNIIQGLAVGLESVGIPIVAIAVTLEMSYHWGRSAGLAGDSTRAGVYGTAVATMGMLCTSVFALSMSSFGPIADNAGGIVEMSAGLLEKEDAGTRRVTDILDAAGNTTKASIKGFSVASAALSSFLLSSAFMDEVEIYSPAHLMVFTQLPISSPDVMIGGLLGGMTVIVFAALALKAVGRTAGKVVQEVRNQFKERPNIINHDDLPNYERCVAIVGKAALREMVTPGLLAALAPVTVGALFRIIGESRGEPMLGVQVLSAFLIFSTSIGSLVAIWLDNFGGSLDNAKKLVESGEFGGKGSATHKATVIGDTVGDPCKDTAGPSVHVLIKLIGTVTLLCTPLFVPSRGK